MIEIILYILAVLCTSLVVLSAAIVYISFRSFKAYSPIHQEQTVSQSDIQASIEFISDSGYDYLINKKDTVPIDTVEIGEYLQLYLMVDLIVGHLFAKYNIRASRHTIHDLANTFASLCHHSNLTIFGDILFNTVVKKIICKLKQA